MVLIRSNALGPRPSLSLSLLAGYRIGLQFLKSLVRHDVVASWPQIRRDVLAGSLLRKANGVPGSRSDDSPD